MAKIYNISEIAQIIAPIARSYGIGRLSLFGSYARGEATSQSDIDLHLMDKGSLKGLFRFAGFCRELAEQFEIPVDVLPTDALDDDFLERISKEEVIIYE
jgi:predicted nucleotidyltransferase